MSNCCFSLNALPLNARFLQVRQTRRTRMEPRALICDQTAVAMNIGKKLLSSKEENTVFSPVSIQLVLSIIGAGSKGPTRDQVLSFLRFKTTDDLNSLASQLVAVVLSDECPTGGPRLCFANGAWVEQSLALNPSFKHLLHTQYKSALASVDFVNKAEEVRNEVNSWAKEGTNGLIKELLPPQSVNCFTMFICANALYFKGMWNEKFDESITKDYDFHLLNGSSVKVPFMISYEDQFISAFDGFKVLSLPYKKGKNKCRYSMCLFLPDAKDGLSALVEKVGSESGLLECKLPREKVQVGDFRIPRFKISVGFELSNVLKELGLILPFSDDADLTEMVDGQNLCVSQIFHKSFIEVNEEGTEAAAADAATFIVGCSSHMQPPTKIDFVADHPFLFLIREDITGTILFIGQVLNPLAR